MRLHEFVDLYEGYRLAQGMIQLLRSHAKQFFGAEFFFSKIDTLSGAKCLKGKDRLEILGHLSQFESGRSPHRDVVLDICRTRYRIDTRRMSEDLVLRGNGGGGILDDRECWINYAIS